MRNISCLFRNYKSILPLELIRPLQNVPMFPGNSLHPEPVLALKSTSISPIFPLAMFFTVLSSWSQKSSVSSGYFSLVLCVGAYAEMAKIQRSLVTTFATQIMSDIFVKLFAFVYPIHAVKACLSSLVFVNIASYRR